MRIYARFVRMICALRAHSVHIIALYVPPVRMICALLAHVRAFRARVCLIYGLRAHICALCAHVVALRAHNVICVPRAPDLSTPCTYMRDPCA